MNIYDRNIYGFDCETTPIKKYRGTKFKFLALYSNRDSFIFRNKLSLISFIYSLQKSTIFISYNLPFDMFNTIPNLSDIKAVSIHVNLDKIPHFVRIVRKLHHKKITILFLGLENYVGSGDKLNNLAKIWEVGNKIDVDVEKLDKELRIVQDAYCMNDAKIVYDIFTKYFYDASLKHVALSSSSLAFKKACKMSKVRIDNYRSYQVIKEERLSYMGGRNEAFRILSEKCNYYDFNSLYPTCMCNDKLPYKFKEVIYNPTIEQFLEVNSDNELIGLVKATVEVYYPCLPFKCEGHLLFPIGIYTYNYVSTELGYYFIKGYVNIIDIKFMIVYQAKVGLFENFIMEHYNKRLLHAKGTALNEHYKILMNSSYGKFAQRERKEIELFRNDFKLFPDVKNNEKVILNIKGKYYSGIIRIRYGKYYLDVVTDNEAKGKFTMISASISANARLRLFKKMEECLFNLDYCDTDSLFTETVLPVSDKLGDLKLVDKGKFIFKALKFYEFNNKAKTKGIPKNAEIEKETETYIKYKYSKVLKYKESLIRKKEPYSIYIIRKIVKKWVNYAKGYVYPTYNIILPLEIYDKSVIIYENCANVEKLREMFKYWNVISISEPLNKGVNYDMDMQNMRSKILNL